jgi:tetratricopeptide (TPR) repeat protein
MRTTRFGCLLALFGIALLAGSAEAQRPLRYEPPTDEQRTRFARQRLLDARAFVKQERLDAAERALLRGLDASPEDARLHDLLARVLAAQGRDEQASVHRGRAEELAPPPPPVPDTPLIESAAGLLVALVPPSVPDEPPERVAGNWPSGIAAQTLQRRLRLRLPGAAVVHANPQTVAEARALLATRRPASVLSYRVERAYCNDTIKDGPFAVAWLRVAGEIRGETSAGPDSRRDVILNPRDPGDCRAEALARGLERSFRHRVVRRALAERGDPDRAPAAGTRAWSNAAIRTLFPGIGERIRIALVRGRDQITAGRIADARDTFRAAAEADPEDAVVKTYLVEIEATLAIAHELELRRDPVRFREEDLGVLDPRYSAVQRAAAEARLDEARREREDLLAVQAALGEAERTAGPAALAALRLGETHDPDAFGPRTARQRSGGEVEARVVYTPNGHEIARYYLPAGGGAAVLREEDVDGDGRADRWIVYRDGVRSEIWEDGHGHGRPDVRFSFSPDGVQVVRVAIDSIADGRSDRILGYEGGVLISESSDTDGDGVKDQFDRFDSEGYLETRDEDLDGDGVVDMRSTYRGGRLVERSIRDADLMPGDS